MSDQKKDLTRIEDLGEFLHELDETENFLDLPALPEEDSPPDMLPDLPEETGFAVDEAPPEFIDETPAEDSLFASEDNFSDSAAEETDENSFETSFEAPSEDLPTEELPESDFSDNNSPFELSNDDAPAETSETAPFELSNDSAEASFATDQAEPHEEQQDESPSEDSQTAQAPLAANTDNKPVLTEISLVHNFENLSDEAIDPTIERKPEPTPEPEVFTPKEDFAETRQFAEHAVINDATAECNPAFSVVAKNIRFLEDSEEILSLLKEAGFPDDMRDQFKRQIERGTLLIPRVSEYTAIYLCHKLRRFRLDLTMGLSDMIHPPKKAQEIDKGLVSRKSLGQNYQHQFQFKGDMDAARSIILSTLPQLDGHAVDRYLGVASEHTFLDSQIVENETAEAIHKSYDELALKLKGHALHSKANAVLGINYQLTPMPVDHGSLGHYRYKLTCTGNLVWLHKINN